MPVVWEVERVEGCQRNGRTRPLVVASVLRDADGQPVERATVLAKAMGLPQITDTGLFAEYFGGQLAVQFGIDAPSVSLIHLDDDLINANAAQFAAWGINPQPGRAVGIEFRKGMMGLSALTQTEKADALLIYAFDLLVQNPDRRKDNPNCASLRRRIVAYDFEMAFSFLYPIIGQIADPWAVSHLPFCRQHVFHHALSVAQQAPGDLDWNAVRASVSSLDESIEQLVEFLPPSWTDHGNRVVEHVHAVNMHRDDFVQELQGSLA